MIPALEEATGEKFPPSDQFHTTETNEFLQRVLKKMKIECPPPLTNARMIDRLVGEYIEYVFFGLKREILFSCVIPNNLITANFVAQTINSIYRDTCINNLLLVIPK